jgi:hypothetical protein
VPERAVPPLERRHARWLRVLWAWFFDTDLDTLEKLLITGQIVLAFAVLVLNSRLIAVPPPAIQGWTLVLPAPLWFGVLLGLCVWHIRGRGRVDFAARRDAAFYSALVCGGLCGSLWLRAPTVLVLVLPGVVGQILVAARLSRECKRRGAVAEQ